MESERRIFPVFLSLDAEKRGSLPSLPRFPETPSVHFRNTVTMPPMSHRQTHRPSRWVLRRDRNPRVSSERRQECIEIHMASFRGGSLANQAWQRRPFPLTETAKSYNNRGGWAKTPTTMEVIEPFLFVEGIDQARRVDIAIGFLPGDSEREPIFPESR